MTKFFLTLGVACVMAMVPSRGLTAAFSAPSQTAAPAKPHCARAEQVSIVRDDWGIAHVHGVSDADAVFGMIYAQAEDDFNRIEMNYLTALGRLSEAEGEKTLFQDLRSRLFIKEADLKALYGSSPGWLRQLMDTWSEGLNCYLLSHPSVKPRVLTHFEPWMALSFSEGSIGGDIERVALDPLRAFYGSAQDGRLAATLPERLKEPSGSNGFAIAPRNTSAGHALLLINPHTSFYFRSELQVSSDEGLNAYGATTWGQFFIYQGFNAHLGWMHTSSGVDNVDVFAESIVRKGDRIFYRYGRELRPVKSDRITISYRMTDGSMANRSFTTYATHHGPVIQAENGRLLSIALMQKPIEALSQSYLLTKAVDYAAFMKVMELKANSSNNTIYADGSGNIAYLHPQFIPVRDDRFDFTHVVDGSDPATDWKGLHALNEVPSPLNPANGWIMNTNNWPYSAAGPESPKRESFPKYMDTYGENPRGLHAVRVLDARQDFTLDSLRDAAFDSYLPAFEKLIPALIQSFDRLPVGSSLRASLLDPILTLRAWDYRWSRYSVATTLSVLWGDELWEKAKQEADEEGLPTYDALLSLVTDQEKLQALQAVKERLERDFRTWHVPWGDINRFQRVTDDIVQQFVDASPSYPVGFTSSRWGSLASYGARRYPGTNKYYGTSGNSFVAMVEFGPKIKARAVTAGGESGDPAALHFGDQIERYAEGALRDVYFYPEDLVGHIEREYRPD